MTLNLFYEEPEPDRWLPFDHYPRRLIRRLVRGKHRPGGQMRVYLNLRSGLDKLGVKYRINDYRHIQSHPKELACIIGKPHVLDKIIWKNPILYGAAVPAHPFSQPGLLKRLQIHKILVPGEWMRKMCEPHWGAHVLAWPVGIDSEKWKPESTTRKTTDFLIYDKVRWEHDRYAEELLKPIHAELERRGFSYHEIRYGHYKEEDFESQLHQCKAMIFLCEHETQGIAYQQALACGVPILAWDRGGFWQDPEFYPERVRFEPVSSVPYWDKRCGEKFVNFSQFPAQLDAFWEKFQARSLQPRDYILENLTLETCAKNYFRLVKSCEL